MDWDVYIPPGDTENIVRINGLLGDELVGFSHSK